MNIQFRLNGKFVEIEAPPDRRVVDVLRKDLGLTGTKESCAAGDCGACTILVNGETRLSCLMLAAQLQDREITTVEGLSDADSLHPVQAAFIEHGAVQCGFCTSGMVLATVHLLTRNPHPTRSEIRAGIAGNLCRCTGYHMIVDAVEKAAETLASEEHS